MPLKNLLVHLDRDERTVARVEMAVSLARRHDARLVGVFGQRARPEQVGVVATWPSRAYLEAAAAAKAQFEALAAGLPRAEWHDINRGGDEELLGRLTDYARFFDLALLGQHNERAEELTPPHLAEVMAVHSGRPILVLPYAGSFPQIGRRPLIAWNNSREAAHALNDALPLIEDCEEAVLLCLDIRYEEAKASCLEAERHLACHGIRATTEVLTVEDVGVMDMLLNRVTDLGADLLVMGAHGQIGFPFLSRGAGTRYILGHLTVPVLMAS
jgi:nucleotide-binding universal stress UspA family protein